MTAALFVVNLEVGQAGLTAGAPVDHPRALVDPASLVHRHEGLADGAGAALVEREALAAPVTRRAEAPELVDDLVVVLVLDLPDALHELLAAEVVAS